MPLHFDLSVFDLFGTFAAGAQLHLVPPEKNLVPQALIEFIRSSRLTQWFSVPSTLTYMARHGGLETGRPPVVEAGPLVRRGVAGVRRSRYWMERFPDVEFTNLYGPTETTIASSYFTVPAGSLTETANIPIGEPCEGEELLVLDEDLRGSCRSSRGPYIAGVGLSPGYWKDEEKTAEVFRPHPFASDPKERIYRTGDLATEGDEGLFYFHGRNDSQIKSRGYRIELGEIEAAVSSIGLVSECVVLGMPADGFQGTAICCAYILLPAQTYPPHLLRKALLPVLPFVHAALRWRPFDVFPMNANGKVDRRALRELFEKESV